MINEIENFRLCKLLIKEYGTLKNVSIKFYENDREIKDSDVFSSVIIGENGVGKSELLSAISKVFIDLSELKEGNKAKHKYNYELHYIINNNNIIVTSKDGIIECSLNQKPIQIKDIILPRKIICTSFLINDKFLYKKDEEDSYSIYEYQGIRGSRTGTSTKTFIKKVSNNILTYSNDMQFKNGLKELFRFLDLENEILFKYEIRNKSKFMTEYTDKYAFEQDLDNIIKKRKHTPYWKTKFEDIKNNDEIEEIVEVIKELKHYISEDGKSIIYRLNLEMDNYRNEIDLYFKAMKQLMELDIISTPSIIVNKNKCMEYSIEKGSSGETHLLFTITNILSKVQPGSLVIIDEPEISLHPNWQIKYINILKRILKNFYGCHLIIATHSHFMVSDIDIESSSLNIMKRSGEKISIELYNKDTYGWSAENILYNVFDLPTNRNYYLAKELDYILDCIAKGEDSLAKDKMNMVNKVKDNLLDSDPLKPILELIESRI